MNNDYQYEKFEDWFNELECFCLRSERFFDDVDSNVSRSEHMEWLRAAFESARLTKDKT